MRTVRSLLSDRRKKRFRKRTFLGLTPVTRANTIWGKSPALYLEVYVLVLFNHIHLYTLTCKQSPLSYRFYMIWVIWQLTDGVKFESNLLNLIKALRASGGGQNNIYYIETDILNQPSSVVKSLRVRLGWRNNNCCIRTDTLNPPFHNLSIIIYVDMHKTAKRCLRFTQDVVMCPRYTWDVHEILYK